jgi:hypothetical protein
VDNRKLEIADSLAGDSEKSTKYFISLLRAIH